MIFLIISLAYVFLYLLNFYFVHLFFEKDDRGKLPFSSFHFKATSMK